MRYRGAEFTDRGTIRHLPHCCLIGSAPGNACESGLNARGQGKSVRALTGKPGVPSSGLLREVPALQATGDAVVVRTLAVGICGTDREILHGQYGAPVPGHEHLILG